MRHMRKRQATKQTGKKPELNVHRIINVPTAVEIACGLYKQGSGEHTILIYDMGWDTSDGFICIIEDGSSEVKATAGDTHLVGEDSDNPKVLVTE